MAGHDAEDEPSPRSLSRALEAKTRRLAAERLELAERMEREVADLRAECDAECGTYWVWRRRCSCR